MDGPGQGQRRLTALVRAQTAQMEAWQVAELHLLGRACRARLSDLGVRPTPEVAVALMAVATLLGEHAPEWGGEARESLAEVALVGLGLLEQLAHQDPSIP